MTRKAKSPLYRDPVYDGAADPTVIYNEKEQNWWMFYTQRRANMPLEGVAYCYGCKIGAAVSDDGGNYWYYRGALDLEFEFGHNTFWAPEIIYANGAYHMYVSYIQGIHADWSGARSIVHYTSADLLNWKREGPIESDSDKIIDACIFQKPDGVYRMWYKDEKKHSHIIMADSSDLYKWQTVGEAVTDCASEGPNVFYFNQTYYMITDCWDGMAVYRSDDLTDWTRQKDNILKEPGTRKYDNVKGGHADIAVSKGRAYIFYFTHPGRQSLTDTGLPESIRDSVTVIQVAELQAEIDGTLTCDRNQELFVDL